MSTLGTALRAVKWNRIPIHLNIKCVRRCIGNTAGRKVCDFAATHGSKMHVHACVIFLGYLVI